MSASAMTTRCAWRAALASLRRSAASGARSAASAARRAALRASICALRRWLSSQRRPGMAKKAAAYACASASCQPVLAAVPGYPDAEIPHHNAGLYKRREAHHCMQDMFPRPSRA